VSIRLIERAGRQTDGNGALALPAAISAFPIRPRTKRAYRPQSRDMLMRALSLPMVTMFLGTTLASCTREQPASSIIAPSDRALLGVGPHGGGPPGGVVFYSPPGRRGQDLYNERRTEEA
jgi:hypothetical protein